MQVPVITTSSTAKTVEITSPVFASGLSPVLLAQAVRVYRARSRQGTSKTKTRSEINRTHKKWFKQKGTGNARHGARNPSIFVGGGVAHGPNGIQNWSLDMSAQMKRQALSLALSSQAANVMMLEKVDAKVTAKALRLAFTKQTSDSKVLVILPTTDMPLIKMIRNLGNVLIQTADRVTALDVALADKIVMVEGTLAKLEARLDKAATTKSDVMAVAQPAAVTKTAKVAAKPKAVVKAKPATKAQQAAQAKPTAKPKKVIKAK